VGHGSGYDGHRGWVYTLVVEPSYRRAGGGPLVVGLPDLGVLLLNRFEQKD